jgi:hypothetical protein
VRRVSHSLTASVAAVHSPRLRRAKRARIEESEREGTCVALTGYTSLASVTEVIVDRLKCMVRLACVRRRFGDGRLACMHVCVVYNGRLALNTHLARMGQRTSDIQHTAYT